MSDARRSDWDDALPRPVSWSCWYPVSIDSEISNHEFGGTEDAPLFTQECVANDATLSNNQEIPILVSRSSRFRESWDRQGLIYADSRVSKCVAIAPAPPVRAFTPESVSDIKCPTLIISGEADTEAPFNECAVWLSLQNSTFLLRSAGKQVGHYTFLPKCTEHCTNLDPVLCVDHPSITQSIIHDEVASLIEGFLAGINK